MEYSLSAAAEPQFEGIRASFVDVTNYPQSIGHAWTASDEGRNAARAFQLRHMTMRAVESLSAPLEYREMFEWNARTVGNVTELDLPPPVLFHLRTVNAASILAIAGVRAQFELGNQFRWVEAEVVDLKSAQSLRCSPLDF